MAELLGRGNTYTDLIVRSEEWNEIVERIRLIRRLSEADIGNGVYRVQDDGVIAREAFEDGLLVGAGQLHTPHYVPNVIPPVLPTLPSLTVTSTHEQMTITVNDPSGVLTYSVNDGNREAIRQSATIMVSADTQYTVRLYQDSVLVDTEVVTTPPTPALPMDPPSHAVVTFSDITQNSAVMNIAFNTNEGVNRVRYRREGQRQWINLRVITPQQINLTGLNASTAYKYQVQLRNSHGNTSQIYTFSTLAPPSASLYTGQIVAGEVTVGRTTFNGYLAGTAGSANPAAISSENAWALSRYLTSGINRHRNRFSISTRVQRSVFTGKEIHIRRSGSTSSAGIFRFDDGLYSSESGQHHWEWAVGLFRLVSGTTYDMVIRDSTASTFYQAQQADPRVFRLIGPRVRFEAQILSKTDQLMLARVLGR